MASALSRLMLVCFLAVTGLPAGIASTAMQAEPPILMDARFSGFDTIAHVRFEHPQLAPLAEVISHWAGYYSVNPILLTQVVRKRSLEVLATAQEVEALAALLALAGRTPARPEAVGTRDTLQSLDGISLSSDALDDLLDRTSKAMAQAGLGETLAILADEAPALDLPFALPQAWQFNGVHTWTGDNNAMPMSSLDFTQSWQQGWGDDTSQNLVSAAHDGEVTLFSSCFVHIQHPGGWGTRYYHLDNLAVTNGQLVKAGDLLGNYASDEDQALCSGGHSTGPHLHFALLLDNQYTDLAEHSLSGYGVHPGEASYDAAPDRMWLEKRDVRYYAFDLPIGQEVGDNTIDYRYNGMWFTPEHDGHGVNIEISEFPDGQGTRNSVFVVVFTYDDAGEANFYVGAEEFERWRSDEAVQVELLQTSGGNLSQLVPIDFDDPNQVAPAGHAELRFFGCDSATADLTMVERESGQLVTHTLELVKLIGVPQHACAAASLPLQ